jgi:hypothetical protein
MKQIFDCNLKMQSLHTFESIIVMVVTWEEFKYDALMHHQS